MLYSKILGTGSYLPKKILTNADIEKIVDTSHEWIMERVGIEERRIADDEETTTSLAKIATTQALRAAELQSKDIDFIIVGTCTPEYAFPSTACLLQKELNIPPCGALDVTAACSGFIYALSIADTYIRTQQAKYALVVGSEVISRKINWQDRSTCVLFGDGAGAVILGASDKPGIHSTHLHADGRYGDLLYAKYPVGSDRKLQDYNLRMTGNRLFRCAVNTLEDLVAETLEINEHDDSELDWLIPHQANRRIIEATAKKLNLSMEKVILTLHKHGNTSAASIPLALDTAVHDGRIKRGQKLLLEAFGGGLTWGSALITY